MPSPRTKPLFPVRGAISRIVVASAVAAIGVYASIRMSQHGEIGMPQYGPVLRSMPVIVCTPVALVILIGGLRGFTVLFCTLGSAVFYGGLGLWITDSLLFHFVGVVAGCMFGIGLARAIIAVKSEAKRSNDEAIAANPSPQI